MVQSSIGPDQEIRVELIEQGGFLQQVHLGKDYNVVHLKCELRVSLPIRGRRFYFLLSDALHMRVVPNIFEVVHFLKNEDCIVRLAVLPDELLELLGPEDYEIGLCLQEQFEVREIQFEGAMERAG